MKGLNDSVSSEINLRHAKIFPSQVVRSRAIRSQSRTNDRPTPKFVGNHQRSRPELPVKLAGFQRSREPYLQRGGRALLWATRLPQRNRFTLQSSRPTMTSIRQRLSRAWASAIA
jgi:hypothetical protein